jgi:hypothetical protein
MQDSIATCQRLIKRNETIYERINSEINLIRQANADIKAIIAELRKPAAERPIEYRDSADLGQVIRSMLEKIEKNEIKVEKYVAELGRYHADVNIRPRDEDNLALLDTISSYQLKLTALRAHLDSLRARSAVSVPSSLPLLVDLYCVRINHIVALIAVGMHIITPPNQKKSSLFVTASPVQVFGHFPLSTRFDPTDGSILSALIPSPDELDESVCQILCSELLNFRTLGETKANPSSICVTQQFNDVLSSSFETDEYSAEINSLSFQDLMAEGNTLWPAFVANFSSHSARNIGICTRGSVPDFTIFGKVNGKKLIVGLGELKGMDTSIDAAVLQAAVGGSYLATNLLSLGFEAGSFCVPLVCSNGMLMQFGAIVILPNSTFPVYMPVSDSFDLRSQSGNQLASAYFKKACQYAHILAVRMSTQHGDGVRVINSMEFSKDMYFVKKFTLQGVLKHYNAHNLQCGLNHMIRCFNTMYKVEALRSHIAFPVAVYTESENPNSTAAAATAVAIETASKLQLAIQVVIQTESESVRARLSATSASTAVAAVQDLADSAKKGIENGVANVAANPNTMHVVFRHYGHASNGGYMIGCPDRIANPELFNHYKLELIRVVKLMHSSGVIHGDLYLSNVMWRATDSGVHIILIDFDCAHLLEEGQFTPGIQNTIFKYFQANNIALEVEFRKGHDRKYLKVLDLPVTADNAFLWHLLASNDVKQVNQAFFKLFQSKYSRDLGQDSS